MRLLTIILTVKYYLFVKISHSYAGIHGIYVRLCEYSQKTLSYWWKMFKTLHIMGLKNGQSDIKVGYVGLSVGFVCWI